MSLSGVMKKCIISTFTVALLTSFYAQTKINKDIELFVMNNLESIIEAQENKLGIDHKGSPRIIFGYPDGYTAHDGSGFYHDPTDTIYLPKGLAITPESNLSNKLAEILSFGRAYDILDILDHELGHFYIDKIKESKSENKWDVPVTYDQKQARSVVCEGVAEYFKITLNNIETNLSENYSMPTDCFELTTFDIYVGGYHLVKPIIDLYGSAAIHYFIDNPPNSVKDLKLYQNKALNALSSK